MRLEVVLHRLGEEQAQLAREAMEQPARDPFDHGRLVGMYAGLARARAVILGDHEAEEERRNRQ